MRLSGLMILAVFLAFPLFSAAADDFGQRFTGETPSALAAPPFASQQDIALEETAEDLQEITPAAGDVVEGETAETDDSSNEADTFLEGDDVEAAAEDDISTAAE